MRRVILAPLARGKRCFEQGAPSRSLYQAHLPLTPETLRLGIRRLSSQIIKARPSGPFVFLERIPESLRSFRVEATPAT